MARGTWWCALVIAGCGSAVDVVDHEGGGGGGGGSGSSGDEAPQGDPSLRGGNYPEPALTVCGVLPSGVEPIDDLATAWVVEGNRPANSSELPVAATVPRLRLGSIGIGSDEDPNAGSPDPECGQQGWFFAFDLPEPLVPGVLQLAELAPSYPEAYEGFADGCGAGGGPSAASTPANTGELEIFAVTDTCVMGEIRGAIVADTDLIPVKNGGFVAERDGVACVPMFFGCE